jgi:Chalcone isomerase-like
MNTRRPAALLTSLLLVMMAALSVPTLANTPPAPTAAEALSGQRAIGQTLFRWWGLEVYRATLYASAGFDPLRFEQQRFALELEYRRAFDGEDIARRSLDEMQVLAPLAPAQSRDWLDRMTRAFPDVQPGDRLLGVHEPGAGARFYLNGRLLDSVDDPAFSARFFAIWLSPQTSQPRMREALIAGAAR